MTASQVAPAITNKPLGFSWFPDDVGGLPKSYFDDNDNIFNYFYQHDVVSIFFFRLIQVQANLLLLKGGHFSSYEQPNLLWADIEDFVSHVWKN
jgi:hypothetical protein